MVNLPRLRIPPPGLAGLPLFSSVTGRLTAGFGLLVIILIVVVSASAWLSRQHRSDLAHLEATAATAAELEEARFNMVLASLLIERYLVTGNELLVPEIGSGMTTVKDSLAVATSQEEMRGDHGSISVETEVERLDELVAGAAALSDTFEQVIALQQSGEQESARQLLEAAAAEITAFELLITEAAQEERGEIPALQSQADRTADLVFWLLVVFGAGGATLGLAASVFIARSILKPLSSVEAVALAVADGNLEARAQPSGPKELASLGASLNRMTESLLEVNRSSLEEMASFAEMNPAPVLRLDRHGTILLMNPAARKLFDNAEPSEKSWYFLCPGLKQDAFDRLFQGLGKTQHEQNIGDKSYLFTYRNDPNRGYVNVYGADITERERAEETLRESESRYRTLVETSLQGIEEIDTSGMITFANAAHHKQYEYSEGELLGMSILDLAETEADRKGLREYLKFLVEEQPPPAPYFGRKKTKSGKIIDVEVTWNYKLDAKGQAAGFVSVITDITERKKAEAALRRAQQLEIRAQERRRTEEKLRHLAHHDPLTDLPNRTLLKDRLAVALAQARRNKHMLGVMFLDLDRFKAVNDTVGHPKGDELLKIVSRQLKELVREGDTVARVGGDEFVLLLPAMARVGDATEVAQRILKVLGQPQVLSGHEFHITASIGITIFPTDGDDPEALLTNSDIAMYHAKEQGRNNYQLYTPALNASVRERLALENDLRHGLEREEFVVYYQPQVNISTGQIVGTEALLRWQHPGRGLVMPMEFIPVAEETGLIVPLGEWVLRTACAQAKAWQDAGLSPLRMAVNLSSRQFQQPDLAKKVKQVLQETGLDPHCLQLEITEGVAIQDVDYAIMMLRHLKELGVQIAIDDFGTGYSSLSYLRHLPIDVLKIDRSFIGKLTSNPKDAAITATVIAMAHNLDLYVIAEGVETNEQLAFLKEQACDEMQGYLFSRSVPAEALQEILVRDDRSQVA